MYRLVFQSRDTSRAPVTGDEEPLVIGRHADCKVQLAEAGVRDRHAAIERRADGYYIRDLTGTRTVRVNDQAAGDRRLSTGDEVEIGAVRLRFQVVQPVPDGRRSFDALQALAGILVIALVIGQLAFFGWIFSQPHPRNMKTDLARDKKLKNAPPPPAPIPQPLQPLVPLTPAPVTAHTPAALSRMLKITRVDRATDGTLRIQVRAQVGERQLDLAAVAIHIQCPGSSPQTIPLPGTWENFTTKQLTAQLPANCPGPIIRTYYRQQLQDSWTP